MKKTVFILLVILIGANSTSAFSRYNEGFNMFYASLEPHGEWIEIDYNLYAWQPNNVRYSWRPYSDGRWEWTRHGWYWVSYEPFGWATYHYGRWFHDDYYGWLWIPDTEWGPSWVEWRYNNNYIGWAPLPPYARFNNHRGIHFSVSWNSGYYHWSFVDYHHFRSSRIHVHIVNNYRTYNIFNNTKYRTNYYARDGRIVNGGVSRKYVERRGGYKIKERKIEMTADVQTYRTRNSDNTRNRVISYKPANSGKNRTVQVDDKKIRKGTVNSTLKKDRIFFDQPDVKKKTVKADSRNEPRKSVTRKSSVTKRDIEKGNSARTKNVDTEETNRKISSRNTDVKRKPDNTSRIKVNENTSRSKPLEKKASIKRNTENKSEKRMTKIKTESKSKKINKRNSEKKQRDTGVKKRTVKIAENDSKKKRLLK